MKNEKNCKHSTIYKQEKCIFSTTLNLFWPIWTDADFSKSWSVLLLEVCGKASPLLPKKKLCLCQKEAFFFLLDPHGRPTVTTPVHKWSLYTHVLSVPTFQNLAKQNKFQAKTMCTMGETVRLAEWIIDDTCLLPFIFLWWAEYNQSCVRWQRQRIARAIDRLYCKAKRRKYPFKNSPVSIIEFNWFHWLKFCAAFFYIATFKQIS